MAAEDFFARWSGKKSGPAIDAHNAPADIADESLSAPDTAPDTNGELIGTRDTAPKPLPTQEDVEHLTHDSDYSAFMAQGVDESVKRSAMKKLFSNPHFNIMDGLDVYIEDFSKFEPITPAVLASLNHAKALLDPLSQFQAPLMRLLDMPKEEAVQTTPDADQPVPALDHVQANEKPVTVADATLVDDEAKKDGAEPPERREIDTSKESGATRSVDDV